MYSTYDDLVSLVQDYLSRYDDNIIIRIPEFIGLAEKILTRLPKQLGTKQVVVGAFTKADNVLEKPNRWRSTISINYGTGTDQTTAQRMAVSGVRTLYFPTTHNFYVGQTITVSGVGGSGYNGTGLTITAISPRSITYSTGATTEALTTDTGGYVTTAQNTTNKLLPRGYEYCRDYWPDVTQTGDPLYYANYDYNHWFIVPTPRQAFPIEVCYYQQPIPLSPTNQTNWFTEFAPDALLYGTLMQAAPYLKNDERIPTWKDLYSAAINSIEAEAMDNLDDATTSRVSGK